MIGTHGWTLHSWAILLHIVLFAYWLGGDLGVFYSSRFILKPELSTEARGVAVKIMHVVDMSPRICLVLFLPSGITLMAATTGAGPAGSATWCTAPTSSCAAR